MEQLFASNADSQHSYTYPGIRELQAWEEEPDTVSLQSLVESSVFSFVLFSSIFSFLDEDNFVEEV